MNQIPIDAEARAGRFISAMQGLTMLVSSQVPGLPIDSENLSGLLDLLTDEAKNVVPPCTPAKGAANDR